MFILRKMLIPFFNSPLPTYIPQKFGSSLPNYYDPYLHWTRQSSEEKIAIWNINEAIPFADHSLKNYPTLSI